MTEKPDPILSAERTLAVRFPEDYARWLQATGGFEGDLGGCYLSLFGVRELVEQNLGYAVADFMPELILIGTDGGGEGIGLDMRGEACVVVLVNLNSLRWDQSIYQAASFDVFLEERLRGDPLRWETT